MKNGLRCSFSFIIGFSLFTAMASYASQTDFLIPYNSKLFDLQGNVIVSNETSYNKITYTDDYWIVESQINIPFGNVREAKDFASSFTKTGNILNFKIAGNLTYLGADRLAYYYKDTRLSVLIDTDGNLISPAGSYFNTIGAFINGVARVTQGNEKKYVNLQGEFVDEPVVNVAPSNPLIDLTACKAITLNSLFLCLKDKQYTLVNLNSNTTIPLENSPYLPSYYGIEKLYSDKFWLRNNVDGYSIYQLYDSDGHILNENQFIDVRPFFDQYGWVKAKQDGAYQLIDTQGKLVGDQYHSIDIKLFGRNAITYAKKVVPINKYDNKYFLSIIDSNGTVLFYEDEVSEWEGIACSENIRVLKNNQHQIAWPQDMTKACMLANFTNSPVARFTPYGNEKKQIDNYPAISTKQVLSLADDILSERAKQVISRRNDLDLDFYDSSQYITGPAVVSIGDIAQLNLPKGYIYVNTYGLGSDCSQYIMPAYTSLGKICLSVYHSGYINLAEQKTIFDQEQQRKKTNEVEFRIKPEIDLTTNAMKFAYFYHIYNDKAASYYRLKELKFDTKWNMIKFANDHLILLTSGSWRDAQLAWQQMDSVNWAELIEIKPPYQYDQKTNYACSSLPLQDSTLSRENYDFLSENTCFPLPLTSFLDNKQYVSHDLKRLFSTLNKGHLYAYSYQLK